MYFKVNVPDEDECRGCRFLSSKYKEIGHCYGIDVYSCKIFGDEIKNFKKCTGCMICCSNSESA